MTKTQFHKGTFKIAVNSYADGETGTRAGLISSLFGIHGNKYGYTVTHLASGNRIADPRRQAQAKQLVIDLSGIAIDWREKEPFASSSATESLATVKTAVRRAHGL